MKIIQAVIITVAALILSSCTKNPDTKPPKVELSIFYYDQEEEKERPVKKVISGGKAETAKLSLTRTYYLRAKTNDAGGVKTSQINIDTSYIASGNAISTRSEAKTPLLFAQIKLKPMANGTIIKVSASGEDFDTKKPTQTPTLTLIFGFVKPEITNVTATPKEVEVKQPITVNWTIKKAVKQQLLVSDQRLNKTLDGISQTATIIPENPGKLTARIKATSLSGHASFSQFVNVDVIPPIRCTLVRPKDQTLQIKGLNNNRRLDHRPLVGTPFSYRPQTRIISFGQHLIIADKTKAIIHQIITNVTPSGDRITSEENYLLIYDLRTCGRARTVQLYNDATFGKIQIMSKGKQHWALFTSIRWSGNSISSFRQYVNAHTLDLNNQTSKIANLSLIGIPYEAKGVSFYFNKAKDRAAIIAMQPPSQAYQRNGYYYVYVIDPTKKNQLYLPYRTLFWFFAPSAKKVTYKEIIWKDSYWENGVLQHKTKKITHSRNRHRYDFSKAITKVTVDNDWLKVEGKVGLNEVDRKRSCTINIRTLKYKPWKCAR